MDLAVRRSHLYEPVLIDCNRIVTFEFFMVAKWLLYMSHRNLELYGFDSYPCILEISRFNKKLEHGKKLLFIQPSCNYMPLALYNNTDNSCLKVHVNRKIQL